MQHWMISSCCSFVASVLFEVALCVVAGLVLEEELLVVEEEVLLLLLLEEAELDEVVVVVLLVPATVGEVRSAAITSANRSSKSSSAV
jgi:hypothetical protein